MISRLEAMRRLLRRWLEEVERDERTAERLPLRYILTDENIEAVARLDLYSDYDDSRDRQMLRAWLAPRQGGLQ